MIGQFDTPLPPPPRTVVAREGARSLAVRWGALFLTALFTAACGAAAVHQLLVTYSGNQFEAVITDTYIRSSFGSGKVVDTKKKKKRYMIAYSYELHGKQRNGRASIGMLAYSSVSKGQPLTVRYWPPTNGLGAIPNVPKYFEKSTWILLLLAVVGCGMTATAMKLAWLDPRREKALVMRGIAVPATVTARTMKGEKTKTYELSYQYAAAGEHAGAEQIFRGNQRVTAEFYEQHPEGAMVTALYQRGSPSKSILYEAGRYQIAQQPGFAAT